MSVSDSRKEEAEIWLKTSLEDITSRLGLHLREERDASQGNVSPDMLKFVGFAQQAVYRGMERELVAVEKNNGSLQHVRDRFAKQNLSFISPINTTL